MCVYEVLCADGSWVRFNVRYAAWCFINGRSVRLVDK